VTPPADSDASGTRPADDARAADAAAIRVVYCGGCNTHIDRGAVARELAASPTFTRPGAAVYLSGCQRACASDHQLAVPRGAGDPERHPDDPAVVVAGAHVDGVPTPAADLAAAVIDKLKE
jgi:hypothetical protein